MEERLKYQVKMNSNFFLLVQAGKTARPLSLGVFLRSHFAIKTGGTTINRPKIGAVFLFNKKIRQGVVNNEN
ncbi:hypothetical protein CRI83_06165 [Liquorilactobacillus nagelii]|nr:hypothetical protein [Liquorilactobacillus nagelii]